ncbi:uncharacterized protein TRAVEDRAFT_60069 [Trametes versicolor FP-101664 SS1]|uniref:uncharacterized protein n=1 Tax=Trametes versicolor (strain FP-101664) TaxID=717944 RepID=UPI0004622809|nr:uncharacterized protein TRAVEDRAFT_60069 [Trametes versicolor FP-101664 SS1]EIW56005.1 hypothetical protein TRAVEDRAFT_60069 [Trametes versicolor FP-101664 SS1]
MGALDSSLGALLIGTWFNAMLYMLEIMQVITYYRTFPKDRLAFKLTVAFSFFVDLLGTANNCAVVYLYTITNWGNQEFLLVQGWTIPTYLALSGLSAFVCQLFLSWRFYNFSKNWFVTAFLVATTLVAFIGSDINADTVVKFPKFTQRDHNIKTVTIWLVASACSDVCIAAALVWSLRGIRSSFDGTKSLIRRLTYTAIQTGAATSVLAVICLIFYRINTESNITVGFGFCLGRAYTLTMLFNLNTRVTGRADSSSNGPSGASGVHDIERDATNIHLNSLNAGGINVHRTAIVHIDEGTKTYYAGEPAGSDTDVHSESERKVNPELR